MFIFFPMFLQLNQKHGGKEMHNKRMVVVWALALLLGLGWGSIPRIGQADVDWKIVKDMDLKTSPLDVTPSMDGKWLFILTPGEILIFSISEGTITDRIPVDKDFDRIAPLPRPGMLTITSNTKKTLQVILFEIIHKIDVTGLPFKGSQEAPITIVAFDDYQ